MIIDRIEKELDSLKEIDRFRQMPSSAKTGKTINVASNSYLHLEDNIQIQEKAQKLISSPAGNLASRLVQSTSPLFEILEDEVADWKNTEAALIFNSGYAANIGIIQALARRKTEIFSDRLNHASIIDGIRLSDGKMIRYNHNDMDDLDKKLSLSQSDEKIIVTDTVFSMDGDCANLTDTVSLAQKHNALLMVDEAHSSGIFGKTGSGLVEELGLEKEIAIRMGTFSKAIAGGGGFFAGSQLLKEYFINRSRSFIFSTALPESVLAWNLSAIRYIRNQPNQGKELLQRSHWFRKELQKRGYNVGDTTTQIIPIIVKEDKKALTLSLKLREAGIIAPAIRPPTVPPQSSRIRISLHAALTEQQLIYILKSVDEVLL